MPTQTTLTRVESFPFDSRADGYDSDGYPVYDRAVGASMLRSTFAKFFTDGVFPSPGNALQISKGSGLTVTIQPGIFIIRGAMGGYLTDAHSITLDTAAPQGNVCYGVMLRYDENEQYRSCYLRVVRGDAASSPQPPAPDQSTPGVMEYRLGYVTVPTGATDLTSATVTNEKGLEVCPYAAPFVELDVGAIVHDAQAEAAEIVDKLDEEANTSLENVQKSIEENMALIESALDGTTAGHLQNQIDELKESTLNEDSLNARYFEFTSDTPDAPKKLSMKESSIGERELQTASVGSDELQDGSVTMEKFDDSAIDTSGGLASSDALFRTTNDVFELAYKLNLASLDSLDVDTVFKWDFNADATLDSGQWNGTYYYADKGTGN